MEPVGKLSDSPTEEYDFSAALSQNSDSQAVVAENGKKMARRPRSRDGGGGDDSAQAVSPGEHVVVVRVWDRFDNMSASKTVTK